MNIQEYEILKVLLKDGYINQRSLSERTGFSLGFVNKSLKDLFLKGYINDGCNLTLKSFEIFENNKPKRAIILAAGFGMRMVPINTEVPKGLLEVNNETLIDRIIKQLHEVNIKEIYVVVGFLKEKYEYLIDEYGIELVCNSEYSTKNNLYSLSLVKKHLENTYIIPCDVWNRNNPFNENEIHSWYMVSDLVDDESDVRVNRKQELVTTGENNGGNTMIGIAYINKDDSRKLISRIEELTSKSRFDNSFWEEALYEKDRMFVYANVVSFKDVFEINTYEQLRELDNNSNQLKTDAIDIICEALKVTSNEITDINVLKKGMTNRSFLFACNGKKYIMRIPGEGTDMLINRKEEASVYEQLRDKNICDDIAYINPDNGYKITQFLEGARVCDSENNEDVYKCMKRLRQFHNLELKVEHEFDIFKQMEFYETLWDGKSSIYKDYKDTKENVLKLRDYIEKHIDKKILTHIDAVPDNFLFFNDDIRLIDWEYAGMQDPHVDIAMFAIYSLYNKEQIDTLIDSYFIEGCDKSIRIKIYCYIATCGLLWSNWCEYKRNLGIEFGEYSLRQYRYAKDYYKIVKEELENESR